MSTRTFYVSRGETVDLASCSPGLYREIASLRGQLARDDPPVLICLGNGEPLFVARSESGRYFARHFPGGNPDGHMHPINPISIEHLHQCEYCHRAADDGGLKSVLEYSTGAGTRLDLAVFGQCNTGIEVQRSHLSRARAKTRARKSRDAGFMTAWIHDSETTPDWEDHTPTARMTTRSGWTDGIPPKGSANAIISDFTRERDKGRWRYRRVPTTTTLDDLVVQMAAGEIVPAAMGNQGKVVLTWQRGADMLEACTYEGASIWNPTDWTPQTKEAAQSYSTDCAQHPALTLAAPSVRHVDFDGQGTRITEMSMPFGVCRRCGQVTRHPASVETGLCRRCCYLV